MGRLIGVVGPAGSGKSTSIGEIPLLGYKGLNPKETAIINVVGKPFPFVSNGYKQRINTYNQTGIFEKVQGGNLLISKNPVEIIQFMLEMINITTIKNIVIDDFQYVMSTELMENAFVKGYEKFTKISANAFFILMTAINAKPDLNVVILTHSEPVTSNNEIIDYKIKTIGKMLDQNITLEGLFSILLFSDSAVDEETGKRKKVFVTNDNGIFKQAKSPIGMFEELYIPNDLNFVLETINNFYKK